MTELAKDVAAIDVTALLTEYSFDLGGAVLARMVDTWLSRYPVRWVRLAVIEALYQGRYKAISVEQILNLWQRRGKSLYRFNHEFERVVCGRFPGTQYTSHRHIASSQFANPARSYPKPSYCKPLPQTPLAQEPLSQNLPPQNLPPQNLLPQTLLPHSVSKPIESTPPQPVADVPSKVEPESVKPEQVELASVKPIPFIAAWGETSAESTAESTPHPEPQGSEPEAEPFEVEVSESEWVETPEPILLSAEDSLFPAFIASDSLDLEPLVALSNARSAVQRQPIHQFIPSSESSDFYAKLRAVAQGLSLGKDA